jgi:predicted DNA-binding transcriptional regulator YafY
MSRRLERLLAIDEMIRSRLRYVTADFATFLEVSKRTVQDDLAFLRDRYHAPIRFDLSSGWHYTDPAWRLPTVILSTGELFALTLGARMLQAYAGLAYQSQLEGAIARLAAECLTEVVKR